MLIKRPDDIKSSEITPKKVYLNRRVFMRAAALAATTATTAVVYRKLNSPASADSTTETISDVERQSGEEATSQGFRVNEEPTAREHITNYNNFYEFSTNKQSVAIEARQFITRPWAVAVDGLVDKPTTFDLDQLLALPQEERVYRLRCVEAWSMVIPWIGFPLSTLLEKVQPTSQAKYVAFQTLHDPQRMPNQVTGVLDWPYVEGLRIDEAMHPLTLLATGLYGETLPPQNGAPVRLVVPWKYGFKSIKSIVRITLVSEQPPATWNLQAPREYGFYSNVNPDVDHPRWSQAREHRIGESIFSSRPTLLFNGYAEQVAHLYTGMDLRRNF